MDRRARCDLDLTVDDGARGDRDRASDHPAANNGREADFQLVSHRKATDDFAGDNGLAGLDMAMPHAPGGEYQITLKRPIAMDRARHHELTRSADIAVKYGIRTNKGGGLGFNFQKTALFIVHGWLFNPFPPPDGVTCLASPTVAENRSRMGGLCNHQMDKLMGINRQFLILCCVAVLGIAGCSRQQSDWEKTRAANSVESYEQFLKQYPSGEFTAQAQARVKELNEEREWQKARDADTAEAYQAFIKQFPEGKWAEEARIRVENLTLAAPSGAAAGATPGNAAAAPGGSAGPGTAGVAIAGAAAGAASVATAKAAAVKPAATEPAAAKPAAATPATKAKVHAEKSQAAHRSADRYGVQLGAFTSGSAAAHKRWSQLSKKYPTILAGLTPRVPAHKTASGHVYRLEVRGLTKLKAREICKSLKTKSQPCVILHP